MFQHVTTWYDMCTQLKVSVAGSSCIAVNCSCIGVHQLAVTFLTHTVIWKTD